MKLITAPRPARRTPRHRNSLPTFNLMVAALLCALSGAALASEPLAAAPDAAAATPPASDSLAIPEVRVTAERRVTSLQRTAVSVGVIGSDDIEKKNITLLRDLAGTVPGLITPGSSSPSLQYLYIRGIGTAAPTLNGAVALYIDDVYVSRIINAGAFGSPDLQQIEVLRGPQGTLYGQNTSAGAIKINSRVPDEEKIGWISAGIGSFGEKEGKAYFSGPLVPGLLSASVALSKQKSDGNVYNATLHKHVNGVDVSQVRAKFHLTPGDGWDAIFSIDGLADRSDNGANTRTDVAGAQPRVTLEGRDLAIHNNGGGASLKASKRLDENLTLKSITAYRGFRNYPDPWSYDGLNQSRFGWQLNLDQHQVSQELQLLGDYARWNFVSGLIGFKERFKVNRPNYTNNVYAGIASDTDVRSVGAYTQGHFQASDKLGFTAGLRYNRQNDDYDWHSYRSNTAMQELATTGSLSGLQQKTHTVTPKLGLDYQIDRDRFSYASITRGEKAGGYNPVAGARVIAIVPVNPEKVTAYEAGYKDRSLDGSLLTNVSVFYNKFNDYQATVANPVVNGVAVNGAVTVNAGKAHTYGAELDSKWRPAHGLDLKLALAILKTEVDEFLNPTGAANANYKGNALPSAPRLTAGTGVAYALPLDIPGETRVSADANYEAKSYSDTANQLRIPGHATVNLGAYYTSASGHWSTSLTLRNLLDRTYPLSIAAVQALNIYGVAYNQQRAWQLNLRYDF